MRETKQDVPAPPEPLIYLERNAVSPTDLGAVQPESDLSVCEAVCKRLDITFFVGACMRDEKIL